MQRASMMALPLFLNAMLACVASGSGPYSIVRRVKSAARNVCAS